MDHENHFEFNVKDGKIQVTDFTQYESRGDCCLELFCDLVTNWPELLDGQHGTVFYGDAPPFPLPEGGLNFCTTLTHETRSQLIPFPCFSFLRYPEIGIPDAESMLMTLLADQSPIESSKIFWIGADTNPIRRRLVEHSAIHTSVLDATMMAWDRRNPRNLVSAGKYLSIPDHRKYKYLIDCPGIGYSVRLKWLLATGRPVFLVERGIREPWELEMTLVQPPK